jgi:protein gp37
MGEKTLISWCKHTHNHWIGCTKVSPACDGCYAERLMDHRLHRVTWGPHGERALTSDANRRKPLSWNKKAAKSGTRPFVFCSSLADIFDNQVPPEWRRDLFKLIRETPQLVWLLLSKRPQNIIEMCKEAGGMPPNVALGTTIEDQKRAEMNVPHLIAAKMVLFPLFVFVSCEPLLGAIDLTSLRNSLEFGEGQRWLNALGSHGTGYVYEHADSCTVPGIDWVITGGETAQGAHEARPSHPDWFRSLRDQCAAAGVEYHHKQNGEWVLVSEIEGKGRHHQFPDGATVRRVGKNHSGRTIDGIEHNGFPRLA